MTESTAHAKHLESEEISAFVDGELAAAAADRLGAHLEVCHNCALRVVAVVQLKKATARAGNRYVASPDVLARLSANLGGTGSDRPTPRRNDRSLRAFSIGPVFRWAALAAAILLAVTFVGLWGRRQPNALTAELLDQHLAALSSGATPQVLSSDRHTVKPWFQGRLPYSFNLPEPNALPADTVLRGADLAYIEGKPSALLLFSIHKHEVSVFLTKRTDGFNLPERSVRNGFAMRTVTTAELRLTAISDVNPAELEALVNCLAKVQ